MRFSLLLSVVMACAALKENIVQLAEHTSELSTLVSAVVAADLADTLSSAGKFTVFAPTNEAFQKLPPGTLDTLMKPSNKAKLADILKYHVLPQEVLAKQWKQGIAESYPTVEGKTVQVLPGRKQDCSRLQGSHRRKCQRLQECNQTKQLGKQRGCPHHRWCPLATNRISDASPTAQRAEYCPASRAHCRFEHLGFCCGCGRFG